MGVLGTCGNMRLVRQPQDEVLLFEPGLLLDASSITAAYRRLDSHRDSNHYYHPRILHVDPHLTRNQLRQVIIDYESTIPNHHNQHRTVELDGFGALRRNRKKRKEYRLPEDRREECEPLEWQTQRFLSCNNIHEMYLDDLKFINCGGSRCAFEFRDNDGASQVLKVQK